ncbi:GRIP and coiled-coil domain-containing protein 1 [Paroedura picta]|uniref:GRIP and coiled-coil domain-containing protein 1 n=1 Tax=Paroedura picta TaxID=143630 RepID=UPI00405770CF
MEKFGVSFGAGPSRRELQERVSRQQQELGQYQARLRDVVRAYKSLAKEKEALEASLAALSAAHPLHPGPHDRDGRDDQDGRASEHSQDSAGTAASRGPEEQEGAQEQQQQQQAEEAAAAEEWGEEEERERAAQADRRVLQLKTQLATVTAALATVTQEKSRMEASYQADKKKMKQELEELSRKAGQEHSGVESQLRGALEQLAETKARLITQQHDRAQEQSDHAVMLRELQRLLQSERAQRQEAELSLEEAREALAGKAGVASQVEGYEHQAKQLALEAENLRRALQAAQELHGRPDPQLQELQAEMAALKSHFQAQLLQEMRKAAQAEERVQMEEQRVTSLEVQMSEVSELLGTYEKAKQKDQMTILKLKDRLTQLDLENKTLAMAASGRSPLDIPLEDSNLDINILREKMEKLRQLVQAASKHGQCPPGLDAFFLPELPRGTEAGDGEKASAAYYQQELKQLKEEFERYKLRAQVVLKNKSAKDGNLARELEETQEQLAELKEKYVSLRLSCEEVEKQHREELEGKKQELAHLQQLHRQELERSQAACREKILKVEEEMHKQRDRALTVLAEKDQELEQLRTVVVPSGRQGAKKALEPSPVASSSQEPLEAESLETLTQALRLTACSEPSFLLYTEQLARKEVELAALKKEKHRLEVEAHGLQKKLLEEGEKHQEEVAALQGHIQKHCRDQSREGANLEYLKNIFYRFLTLTDLLGRQQTLTAILTILHFSPEERQAVLRHVGGSHGWWQSGKR